MNIFNIIQSKMVQQNNKWNISKEKGVEIVNRYSIEILNESKCNTSLLSNLIILLNQKTRHIKFINNSKKKPISVYLRCIYGSYINFFKSQSLYDTINHEDDIQITLITKPIKSIKNDKHNEWILIEDEDDYILI